MRYFVYILKSKRDGSYYIGWTGNIEERLKRHNEGKTRYTRSKIPWELVYKEEFEEKAEAIKREKRLKKYKSKKIIESLIRSRGGAAR